MDFMPGRGGITEISAVGLKKCYYLAFWKRVLTVLHRIVMSGPPIPEFSRCPSAFRVYGFILFMAFLMHVPPQFLLSFPFLTAAFA